MKAGGAGYNTCAYAGFYIPTTPLPPNTAKITCNTRSACGAVQYSAAIVVPLLSAISTRAGRYLPVRSPYLWSHPTHY